MFIYTSHFCFIPAPPLRAPSVDIHPNVTWSKNGVTVAGGNGRGNESNQLGGPRGLYVDDDQTVYVAAFFNNRIVEWKRGATRGKNSKMMKMYLYLTSFILWYYTGDCTQPYLPPQIVFSPNNGLTTIAIDEINQRAYQKVTLSSYASDIAVVMKHFPYAIPDSPQSKYYVQLLANFPPLSCLYGTY
ncbi:unnamed protein product [Rotaria sp. Silwood2]|nr:unnamed protein product [Rotaria sp. Silwood2]